MIWEPTVWVGLVPRDDSLLLANIVNNDDHVERFHVLHNEDDFLELNPLGNGYEVLDELTQALFLFEHFDGILGTPDAPGHGRRKTAVIRASS